MNLSCLKASRLTWSPFEIDTAKEPSSDAIVLSSSVRASFIALGSLKQISQIVWPCRNS